MKEGVYFAYVPVMLSGAPMETPSPFAGLILRVLGPDEHVRQKQYRGLLGTK